MAENHPVRTIVFLLLDGVSMMSLASGVEPLRSLNRLIGREAWRWRLASLDGSPVEASNGIPLATIPADEALVGADYLFVCGGLRITSVDEKRHLNVLRQAVRNKVAVGSLSTGTYLLARAGLLDGYRCTIHWENRPAFQEEFSELTCTDKLFEIDRDRLTCSGGVAAMDMMLHLIAERHGPSLARRVANQFHHERIRNELDNQSGGRLERLANLPRPVRSAVQLMQSAIEDTLSITAIAERIGMSSRQLERLFLRHFDVTPARYYLAMRIDRARELLLYSDAPVLEIAIATGFTSTSHFGYWFKRLHGARPSHIRRRDGRESDSPAILGASR